MTSYFTLKSWGQQMAISIEEATRFAEGYTAAWNTGSPQAVAEFYALDGGIDYPAPSALRAPYGAHLPPDLRCGRE